MYSSIMENLVGYSAPSTEDFGTLTNVNASLLVGYFGCKGTEKKWRKSSMGRGICSGRKKMVNVLK